MKNIKKYFTITKMLKEKIVNCLIWAGLIILAGSFWAGIFIVIAYISNKYGPII